jgi:hypothetical protein
VTFTQDGEDSIESCVFEFQPHDPCDFCPKTLLAPCVEGASWRIRYSGQFTDDDRQHGLAEFTANVTNEVPNASVLNSINKLTTTGEESREFGIDLVQSVVGSLLATVHAG